MLPFAALMPLSMAVGFVESRAVSLALICVVTFAHMGWKTNQATLTNDIYPREVVGVVLGAAGVWQRLRRDDLHGADRLDGGAVQLRERFRFDGAAPSGFLTCSCGGWCGHRCKRRHHCILSTVDMISQVLLGALHLFGFERRDNLFMLGLFLGKAGLAILTLKGAFKGGVRFAAFRGVDPGNGEMGVQAGVDLFEAFVARCLQQRLVQVAICLLVFAQGLFVRDRPAQQGEQFVELGGDGAGHPGDGATRRRGIRGRSGLRSPSDVFSREGSDEGAGAGPDFDEAFGAETLNRVAHRVRDTPSLRAISSTCKRSPGLKPRERMASRSASYTSSVARFRVSRRSFIRQFPSLLTLGELMRIEKVTAIPVRIARDGRTARGLAGSPTGVSGEGLVLVVDGLPGALPGGF
jgi:hypothetical protein